MVTLCNLIENGEKKNLEQAENGDHDSKMVSSREGRVASPPPTIESFTTQKPKNEGTDVYELRATSSRTFQVLFTEERKGGGGGGGVVGCSTTS